MCDGVGARGDWPSMLGFMGAGNMVDVWALLILACVYRGFSGCCGSVSDVRGMSVCRNIDRV